MSLKTFPSCSLLPWRIVTSKSSPVAWHFSLSHYHCACQASQLCQKQNQGCWQCWLAPSSPSLLAEMLISPWLQTLHSSFVNKPCPQPHHNGFKNLAWARGPFCSALLSKAGLMDAAGLFTCHSLGPGQQLAGTHSWQRAEPWGGAGGGTAVQMDRQTDGWMDGWTVGECRAAPTIRRSFVTARSGHKSRGESWQFLAPGDSLGFRKTQNSLRIPSGWF